MQANFTLKLNHMLKKTIISCAMIGAFALALASSGGGDKKKAESLRKPDFTPIRTTNGFTLKAGPSYTGSHTFYSVRTNNVITCNTVVTYQQGNKVFILPYKSSSRVNINVTPDKSTYQHNNLNAFDLKFRLRK
ncbi:hypothetical protein A4H97_26380 [Niastella yeongjuensis]|uniref:Uncharacterized protein n=2 Tax=Niastella yeongjuensis TaxID=354355 RepID=A0A1V9F012_9BACT|nr:hypothetical protein A4H97_26380 [Niastella yeongjuensis]